jgi:hypothetical protein
MKSGFPCQAILLVAMVCLAASLPGVAAGAEGPPNAPPKPPELKVLDRLIGTWDDETVSRPALWTPKELRGTSKIAREWVLAGRFVQQKSSNPDGSEMMVMHTYDAQKKAYRYWVFGSDGNSADATGQWNAAAQTLIWRTELPDGMTGISSLHFIDADTKEWSLLIKDAAGRICVDMGGKSKRRK